MVIRDDLAISNSVVVLFEKKKNKAAVYGGKFNLNISGKPKVIKADWAEACNNPETINLNGEECIKCNRSDLSTKVIKEDQ